MEAKSFKSEKSKGLARKRYACLRWAGNAQSLNLEWDYYETP